MLDVKLWMAMHAEVERARTGDRNAWTGLQALARVYLLGLAKHGLVAEGRTTAT